MLAKGQVQAASTSLAEAVLPGTVSQLQPRAPGIWVVWLVNGMTLILLPAARAARV